MKDGDIYFWSWKTSTDRHIPYHCKSGKAVAKGEALYDTYWSSSGSDDRLDIEKVDMQYKGNIYEMTIINEWEAVYYRSNDIVDMRHANSSSAKVYIKPGVSRDPETMREFAKYQIEKSKGEIRIARSRIEQLNTAIASINMGELSDVHIPGC